MTTLSFTHDELVLILLGLGSGATVMNNNLARVRQSLPDLKDKLPINYHEICPELDHGWDAHTNLYGMILDALRGEKRD